MKIKKIGNCLLIFTLAFLFLVPSFYPTNAQAPSCQCGAGQIAQGATDQGTCEAGGCLRRFGGTWEDPGGGLTCRCGSGGMRTDITVDQNNCNRDGCEQVVSGTWGVVAVPPAQQQGAQPPAVQQLTNPLGAGADIPEIIARVIKAVLGLVGSIGLLMFVYGGFLWLTAGGSDERVKKGREVLTWAVIGLATIFTSYAILNFIISGLTRSAGQANEESGGRERRQPVRLEDFE